MSNPIPLEDKGSLYVCDCFEEHSDGDDGAVAPDNVLRQCQYCEEEFWSLHCLHDGIQSYCPKCGIRALQLPEEG